VGVARDRVAAVAEIAKAQVDLELASLPFTAT